LDMQKISVNLFCLPPTHSTFWGCLNSNLYVDIF
jgi:hypothetical protein